LDDAAALVAVVYDYIAIAADKTTMGMSFRFASSAQTDFLFHFLFPAFLYLVCFYCFLDARRLAAALSISRIRLDRSSAVRSGM
jgi:hypothetical protein